MTYFGKEYKLVSEENYEEFMKSSGMPEDVLAKNRGFKPSSKLEKDGDTYILTDTTPDGVREIKFKSGVQFDQTVMGKIQIKMTINVNGNVVKQVIESDTGTMTLTRDYDGDNMKTTIINSKWDGVAYRYYKA